MIFLVIGLAIALVCVFAVADLSESFDRLRGEYDRLLFEKRLLEAQVRRLEEENAEVADLEMEIEKLRLEATTDPLTGLPNRRAFEMAFERDQARANHSGQVVVFFVFDLEDFKALNDGLGHPKGDEVLCAFAKALRRLFRREDNVCRAGGDEAFATIIFEVFDLELLNRKRDYFRAVTWNVTQAETGHAMGVSIGFGRTLDEADRHMYLDKNRECTVIQ